jgi:hypothetical protein
LPPSLNKGRGVDIGEGLKPLSETSSLSPMKGRGIKGEELQDNLK